MSCRSASTTTASASSRVGDLLAFWTDGVTERRHRSGMFGEERLLSLLGGLANRPASDVARTIDEAVMSFAPGLPDDDVAILIARVTGIGPEREGASDPQGAHRLARLDG